MNIIAWSSEFALGVDEIDQQHQALVGMINALDASTRDDSSSDTVRQLLRDLNDYVRDHFAFEERLMAGAGVRWNWSPGIWANMPTFAVC